MPRDFLRKIIGNSGEISRDEFVGFLQLVSENNVPSAAVVAFIAALSAKDPQLREMLWFADFIRTASAPLRVGKSKDAVNIVGTGGGLQTFNISTAASFVASAAGATVVKSGSYSYSGQSGSLDVLKALGINLRISLEAFERMVDDVQLGFVNPEWYPPLLKRIAIQLLPLSLRDVGKFINILGPVICPIEVNGSLIGASSRKLFDTMGEVVKGLNLNNTATCWSDIGIDELCSIGKNYLREAGREQTIVLDSERFGFTGADISMLRGGDPVSNAEKIKMLLRGEIQGEQQETVALNSAYLLVLAGVAGSMEEGVERSLACMESGRAYRKLQEAAKFSRQVPQESCS